jgi:hypothetical protein
MHTRRVSSTHQEHSFDRHLKISSQSILAKRQTKSNIQIKGQFLKKAQIPSTSTFFYDK